MRKRWLVGGTVVVVVLAGAAAVAAFSFDPAREKDRIVEAVQRATGRRLTLAGPIHIGWGLTPLVEVEDVSLANMPGGSRPQMASAARVEARVELLPFLSHRIEIASVTLVRPDILLETDANGRGNWQFDRPAASSSPGVASEPGGLRMQTQLDSLRVQAGRLTWRNGITGQVQVAEVPNATIDLGAGPAHMLAVAQIAGTTAKLDATGGTWAQLTGAAPGPWPMTLAASAGDAALSLKGTADPGARLVTGRLEAVVPDLARLGSLFGHPGLPALRDMHLAATLPAGGGVPTDVTVQVGPSDLGVVLAGATLNHVSLTWPSGQPARLDADGTAGDGPWHVATGLLPAGQGAALRGLVLTSRYAELAGDLVVVAAPRPAVRGTLVVARFDGDALRTTLTADAPQPAPVPAVAGAPVPQTAAAASPVLSNAPLPWAIVRSVDADLQASVGLLRLGGADYRSGTGHLTMQDGLARLDPASVVSPAGRVDASASVDARVAAPAVALVVRSAAVSLDAVMQALGLPGGSDAMAELDVVLHAAGASPHALAATLGGHVGLALVDGEISNAALAVALGDLVRQAAVGLDPAGRSHVRCLAVRADATDGVVVVSALKLDTSRLSLDASGTLNLGDETLALRLRPLLRLGGAGVSAPLRLDGPLRRPAVTLDAAAATGRTSLVIGGLAGPAESCTAELTAARDGRTGRMPAEPTNAKAPKGSDLLRSFVR